MDNGAANMVLPLSYLHVHLATALGARPDTWVVPEIAPYWVIAGMSAPAVVQLAAASRTAPRQQIDDLLRSAGEQIGLPGGGEESERRALVGLVLERIAHGEVALPLARMLSRDARARHHIDPLDEIQLLTSLVSLEDEVPLGELSALIVDESLTVLDHFDDRPCIGVIPPVHGEPRLPGF